MRQLIIALFLLWNALCAAGQQFNINCNSNLVMYWGQNSHAAGNPGENQLPLDEYCDKNTGDVLVLSFLSEFNADRLHPPGLNFANSCLTPFDNSTLLHCSNIGKAVKKCQKQGKVVLLSLGGASGAYGFADDTQAERYADEIWDMFLGGSSETRPFDGSVLDGIDLDIEGGSSVGYVRFVQRLRERFTEVPNRRFYVSAAPQCPYPDFYSGPILDNAYLDMVFVQFYNNYCGIDHPNWYNFEQWHDWATTISANKDVRVYLGVPGSPSAASTGHVLPERLEEIVNATRNKFSSFGGMMVWDASQAEYNKVSEDMTFAGLARRLLDSGKKCTDGSDAASNEATDNASNSSSKVESSSSTHVIHKSSDSSTNYEASTKSTASSKALSESTESSRTASENTKSSKTTSESTSSGTSSATSSKSKSATAHQRSSSSSSSSSSLSSSSTPATDSKPTSSATAKTSSNDTVLSSSDVSEANGSGLPTSETGSDNGHFANEHLNRVAVGRLEETTGETVAEDEESSSNSSDAAAEPAGEDSTSEEANAEAEGTPAGQDETTAADDTSAESTDDNASAVEDSTEESTASAEDAEQTTTEEDEEEREKEEESSSPAEEGNETTTVESTKVMHETVTKTRKIHIMTKHVTKRIQKTAGDDLGALTEASPTTTNKTISIVTPTFPLPIARCPRADQPCLGAGFACNGYEFGQCVNNRWLMRPCSTDRVTACFNAGPDLVACDFPKGRSLQV
ncbi:Chitinase 2, partial [Coemansia sp. RSA 2702]